MPFLIFAYRSSFAPPWVTVLDVAGVLLILGWSCALLNRFVGYVADEPEQKTQKTTKQELDAIAWLGTLLLVGAILSRSLAGKDRKEDREM